MKQNEIDMEIVKTIQERVSIPKLTEPGPSADQMDDMIKSALRAPDHGALTPWRFILIEGDARQRHGEALHEIREREGITGAALEKARMSPLRAPSILVVVASTTEGRIPVIEQEYSAAAAAQNIVLTAHAQGLGAIWRSGWAAFHPEVKTLLKLSDAEKIVGIIYLGTPAVPPKPLPDLDPVNFLQKWVG
jgi:nitroreductase